LRRVDDCAKEFSGWLFVIEDQHTVYHDVKDAFGVLPRAFQDPFRTSFEFVEVEDVNIRLGSVKESSITLGDPSVAKVHQSVLTKLLKSVSLNVLWVRS
jgi:hypothetical protein